MHACSLSYEALVHSIASGPAALIPGATSKAHRTALAKAHSAGMPVKRMFNASVGSSTVKAAAMVADRNISPGTRALGASR